MLEAKAIHQYKKVWIFIYQCYKVVDELLHLARRGGTVAVMMSVVIQPCNMTNGSIGEDR